MKSITTVDNKNNKEQCFIDYCNWSSDTSIPLCHEYLVTQRELFFSEFDGILSNYKKYPHFIIQIIKSSNIPKSLCSETLRNDSHYPIDDTQENRDFARKFLQLINSSIIPETIKNAINNIIELVQYYFFWTKSGINIFIKHKKSADQMIHEFNRWINQYENKKKLKTYIINFHPKVINKILSGIYFTEYYRFIVCYPSLPIHIKKKHIEKHEAECSKKRKHTTQNISNSRKKRKHTIDDHDAVRILIEMIEHSKTLT